MADIDHAEVEVALDQAASEVEESPFYEYGDGDEKLSFKTPDELKSHLDKSINFERDYTRKSQARESEYRQKMAEFEKQRKEWEETDKAKYDKYTEALNKRPQIAQALERMVNTPFSPEESFQRAQGYADEKYQDLEKRLESFEQTQKEQQLEREREAIYGDLEKEFPDFSRDKIDQALQGLDGNDLRSLITMVHKAANYNPAEMQERVEQNIAKKQGVGMMPPGAGTPPPKAGSTDPKKVREEAQAWANS